MQKTQKTLVIFTRHFTKGVLQGLYHNDRIAFIDRWHAAQWIRGIKRNSRNGILDYKLAKIYIA